MKSDIIRRAIGGIDADLVEAADRAVPAGRKRAASSHFRISRAVLIAAALTVLLSLGAVAYQLISHANTAALLQKNPFSEGNVQPPVDETGMQIMNNSAIDLGLSQTSNGTTISVDSLMGFTDPTHSLYYLTFTVTPPEGYEFPDNMKYWCFWDERFKLVPEDIDIVYAASTVKNPDGTASVLWALDPLGDPSGHKLHVEIGGFGTADKEVVASLYDGSRQIELPGHWSFEFELPTLPETREIKLDAAALKESGLPVTELRLNEFGGLLWLDRNIMEAAGKGDHLESFTLEYPDGTEYSVSFGEYGNNLWPDYDEQGQLFNLIVFLNPQPIENACAIVIDGVRIPIN